MVETESEPALAGPAASHEVLRALAARAREGSQPGARDDALRIALVIEGGGMRGILSGGMALALAELGLVPAFDAIYGASAGAITGAWLLSRPEGLLGWSEPAYVRTLIRRTAPLRGRPLADVRALIEDLYQTTFPMDFAAVLASPVEFHPLATDAATGQSTDLYPFIGNEAELRLALRASAALPLLAGLAGRVRRPPLLRRGRLGVRPLPHGPGPGRHPPPDPPLPPRPAPSPRPPLCVPLARRPPARPSARRLARPARPACSPAPPSAARLPLCAPPSWPASPAEPPTTSSLPSTKPPQRTLPSQRPIPRCCPSAPPPTHPR